MVVRWERVPDAVLVVMMLAMGDVFCVAHSHLFTTVPETMGKRSKHQNCSFMENALKHVIAIVKVDCAKLPTKWFHKLLCSMLDPRSGAGRWSWNLSRFQKLLKLGWIYIKKDTKTYENCKVKFVDVVTTTCYLLINKCYASGNYHDFPSRLDRTLPLNGQFG